MPSEVLSDRGKSVLFGLMKEVEGLLGYSKVNTTAYHPQTDGLVERYNRTLTSMLAKTTTKDGTEWDEQLPYVMFVYRASQQASTHESSFYLLYGRDPRLPVPEVLSPKKTRVTVNLKEYGIEVHAKLSAAWELARKSVKQAQKRQKDHYDRHAMPTLPFREGERVFLYKPEERTGEARKLARPFHGPYRVQELGTNTAAIMHVDQPEEEPMLVSLDRLRRCPGELGDEFWLPEKREKCKQNVASHAATPNNPQEGGELGASDSSGVVQSVEEGEGVLGAQQDTGPVQEDRDKLMSLWRMTVYHHRHREHQAWLLRILLSNPNQHQIGQWPMHDQEALGNGQGDYANGGQRNKSCQ